MLMPGRRTGTFTADSSSSDCLCTPSVRMVFAKSW
jgi:hypothetical protein